MLLEFRVENFLSFKDETVLNMLASTSIKKDDLADSLISISNLNVLSSVAIFGANASGKSNFLEAFKFMKDFVENSADKNKFGKPIDIECFKLSEETENEPSTFEITFVVPSNDLPYAKNENTIFRYGFQVDKEKVKREWLFARFTAQESKLFTRDEADLYFNEKFKEGRQIHKTLGKIDAKALFLSMIGSIKGKEAPITKHIMEWFLYFRSITSIAKYRDTSITASMIDYGETPIRKTIIKALAYADIGIEDMKVHIKTVKSDELPSEVLEYMKSMAEGKEISKEIELSTLKTTHSKYNSKLDKVGKVLFDFEKEESEGTKRFFSIIGPVILTLMNGLVLFIDEIDARLHPGLV
ncbi:MAG: ATP-binding protein, partial [Candidatus Cloacimonetes bacterium]|nr:ATP-binding protein [Candidatus Cloacimonadota bacterium]